MYRRFGYVYDDILQKHECPYDPQKQTQERPERAVLIHKRLQEEGLLKNALKVHRLQTASFVQFRINKTFQ